MLDAVKDASISQQSRADRIKDFRWQKGVSGNPSGRPPVTAVLSDALRSKLSEQYPGDRKHRTYAEKLAARLIESALRGSVSAIALIYERIEGKAPQALTGANGSPLLPTVVTRETLTATIHSLVSEIVGPDALEAALKSVQSQQTAGEVDAHGA
ncbi:MAG: DUF5681 domain-containing protein [Terriglobales bacterium]